MELNKRTVLRKRPGVVARKLEAVVGNVEITYFREVRVLSTTR